MSSHLISPSYNHCNNYRKIISIAPYPDQKIKKCLGYSLIAIFTFRIYSVPSSQVDLLAKNAIYNSIAFNCDAAGITSLGGGGGGEGGYEGMLSGKLWKNAVAKTCIP